MTQVHRIRGVAGAGKSTTMMEMTEQLRTQHGYSPSDYRWISFSRNHAEDLEGDVVDAWGGDAEDALRANVSTLHSLCVTLTRPEEIITPESHGDLYRAFWSSRGLDVDTDETTQFVSPDEVDTEMDRAAQLLAADQLLAQIGAGLEGEGVELSPAALRRIPVDIDLRAERAIELIEDWREFKRERGLREHHDYILDAANSPKTPGCDVLMVDEMQDYSPLEYVVVRDWIDSGELDHVVLAGDANQSIYGFKLADPSYFTGRDVDSEEVLTESYRCPSRICDVARSVCPQSGITSATDDAGVVFEANTPDADDLGKLVHRLVEDHPPAPYDADPTSVFVLTRTNRQAAKVGWGLRKAGIPYSSTDSSQTPWTEDVLDAIEMLRVVSRGKSAVARESAEAIIEMAPRSEERKQMLETPSYGSLRSGSPGAVDIYSAFPECESAMDIVQRLTVEDYIREMITGAMQSDVDLTPGLVEVGTIHSVKGREAPAVVVMDGYPSRLADKYETDGEFADEEDRLAYVAATRASETLAVARDFHESETFPPFEAPLTNQSATINQPNQGVTSDD